MENLLNLLVCRFYPHFKSFNKMKELTDAVTEELQK